MKVVSALLMTVLYILSAFIMSVLLALGFYFIKPFFMFPPKKHVLLLSEIVVRSQDVVTSYWQSHQQCPKAKDLFMLNHISLVDQVVITSMVNQKRCMLSINLDKHRFANKEIRLLFSFNKMNERSNMFTCYTNASLPNVPSSCRSLRDIDSFYMEK